MISSRAKGVLIVEIWERRNVGLGIRSAYARALAEAEAPAARLQEAQS
jgi:hypothetical protein